MLLNSALLFFNLISETKKTTSFTDKVKDNQSVTDKTAC